MRTRAIASTALLLCLPLTAAACGGPGTFTAHGQEQVCGDLLNGTNPSDYSDVSDGSQVTVIDSKHNVIGTGTLSAKGSSSLEADYTFTVVVPHGQPRYGIQIGNNRGTVWFSEKQMEEGPGESLGC